MKKNLRKFKNSPYSLYHFGVLLLALFVGIVSQAQTIPNFDNAPDDLTVQCIEDVPSQAALTASSDCGSVVVSTFVSHTGARVDSCALSSANDEWSIWLPALEQLGLAPSDNWHFQGNASYVSYDDNSAVVSGVIVNENDASLMMFVEFWLNNAMDWNAWSSLGRSYKDDLNNGTITHVDWTYYEMLPGFSHITGLGSLAGTELFMSHEPANYYYGFQCGMGANDKNTNMGMSGWFSFTGNYDGVSVAGTGDLNVDKSCSTVNQESCVNKDEFTYLWNAEDACGNMANYTQIITVDDSTAPTFTVTPGDITVDCQDWPLAVFDAIEAVDNCNAGLLSLVYDGEYVVSDTPCESQYIRRWIATDMCNNVATYEQYITVVDTEAPVFDGSLADMTIECGTDIPGDMLTATDNCGEPVVELVETVTGDECESILSRTFTATDACGLTTEFTQTITIVDTTPPEFVNFVTFINLPCDEALGSIHAEATDNCGNVTITVDDVYVSGGCALSMIKTYTATDDCGNSSTMQQIVHLVDEVAPVFVTFPEDITIECGEDVPTMEIGEAQITIEDNCTEATLTYEGSETVDGDCPQNYTVTYTWKVIDSCGNEDYRTWTISIVDSTPPVFTSVPENLELDCGDAIPTTSATAEDNCGNVVITYTDNTTGDACELITIRTFTATDECGNSTSVDQMIVKLDTTAPDLMIAADLNLECDQEIPVADFVVDDNCNEVDVVITATIEAGDCPQSYVIVRTYTATDACGNTTEMFQTITVNDTTNPEFTFVPADVTIDCGDDLPTAMALATDNCSADVNVIFYDETTGDSCETIILRTFVATDECGNSTSATQTITKLDTTSPALTVGQDLVLECDETIPEPEYTMEDDCSEVTIDISTVVTPGNCSQTYAIIRTYTATDACGNSTSMTQVITIEDTTAPTFTYVPADITLDCGDAIPTDMASATDNCGSVTVAYIDQTTGDACEMITIRTFMAADECGNTTTYVQTITKVDTTAPTLSIADDVTISCDETIPPAEYDASDDCNEWDVEVTEVIEGGDYCYSITRTYIATDACGNASDPMIQIITVEDNEAPVMLETPNDQVFQCAEDVPSYENWAVQDNCDDAPIVTTTWDYLYQDNCGNYEAVVTCTATDACGNASSVSFTVIVEDVTAPEFVAELEDLVIDCDADIPASVSLDVTDNCSGELTVTVDDQIIGNLPNPDALLDCDATTPATAYYDVDWALMMYMNDVPMYGSIAEANFTEFPNGTAHFVATIISSSNSNGGFFVDVWFENGMDWANWSTQTFPTNYKDQFNLAGDNYLDWTYYLINGGQASMTGWGDFAGSFLSLSHAPSNYYYGFQIGVAANNVNANYGGGGWFTYEGVFVDSSTATNELVNGAGDFAWDGDCCPDYIVERTYCVEDCSGNESCFTQQISFEDLDGIVGGTPMSNTVVDELAASKSFDFVSIAPNPVTGNSIIEFRSNINTKLTLDVVDAFGHKIDLLFTGDVKANTTYRKSISASDLSVGIYLLRLSSDDETTSRRIVLMK